ncbi:MAG: SDR family oxidoreductase [Bacteroidota bacterium]|nr:SDR family oxidoreductase [Bacteroidota bacterium]
MQQGKNKKKIRPSKSQRNQPGLEFKLEPKPEFDRNKLKYRLFNKIAYITGGDIGIGRAVALAFAQEGCDIEIVCYNEYKDAKKIKMEIENEGRKCLIISGDITDKMFCKKSINKVRKYFGGLDIVVNNAAVQFPQKSIQQISKKQLFQTFETNIFSYFYIIKASLKFLKEGSVIINTTSVTAYRGSPELIDYSVTKGAIVSFTRSLTSSLIDKKIRVNAIAPGPVWTPLIPASFESQKVSTFGSDSPIERAAQPEEIAPSYVFLASNDSSFITGQILHPNGGRDCKWVISE